MAKLSLTPAETFKMKVPFPIAGAEPVDVLLTFKHRGRAELAEFTKPGRDASDADLFMEMVTGWDLEDAFSRENVDLLTDNHAGVALAVVRAYIAELTKFQ